MLKSKHITCNYISCYFIGGLFETTETAKEKIFKYAIDRLNENGNDSVKMFPTNELLSSVKRVPQYDSFKVAKAGKTNYVYYIKYCVLLVR